MGKDAETILSLISRGRTDLVIDLLNRADWNALIERDRYGPVDWCVYYNDTTALKLIRRAGFEISSEKLNEHLNSAAFFGHWKVCDALIGWGADTSFALPDTGETALHNAICKAGRPYINHTVRLLLEHSADPNAKTIADVESGAFMRDVRTKGETPLHRAAAFGDAETIELLLSHGADKEARDASGDSPLSWASWHLRPGKILQLLAFGPHNISDKHVAMNTSDHGAGWGHSMERNILGEYLPLTKKSD